MLHFWSRLSPWLRWSFMALAILITIGIIGIWLQRSPKPTTTKKHTTLGTKPVTATNQPATNNTTKTTPTTPTKPAAPAPVKTTPLPSDTSPRPTGSTPSTNSSTSPPSVSSPVTAAYPDASSTGPSGCSSYTSYSGTYTVTTDNTTISCLTLNGTLDVEASNVTVQNSILTGTSWWGVRLGVTNTNATNLLLSHVTLQTVAGQGPDSGGYDYGVAPAGNNSIEVAYSNISGYKDGIDITSGSIHDNYIHNLSQFTGAHTQDIYVYAGGSGVQINHNTLINDTPVSMATAAVYIAPDSGHQNNVTVSTNKLAGGAYALYGGDTTATNIVVKSNVFSTQIFANSGYYGTDAYWQASNSGNIWSGNTWADGPNAGQTVSP